MHLQKRQTRGGGGKNQREFVREQQELKRIKEVLIYFPVLPE